MAFENLGDQLIGAGAGFQGRGVEFNAQLQNQRRQQEQDRQRQEQQKRQAEQQRLTTLFTDANAGLNLAKQGRFDLVNNLAGQRLEASKNFPGVDFNDTQNIFDLSQSAAAGDAVAQQELISTLDDAVLQGRAIGVLETPQGLSQKQQADLELTRANINKLRREAIPSDPTERDRLLNEKTKADIEKVRAETARLGRSNVKTDEDRLKLQELELKIQNQQSIVEERKQKAVDASAKKDGNAIARAFDSQSAIDAVDFLLTDDAYKDIYGTADQFIPTVFSGAVSSEAFRDRIIGLLSLESRQKLKGQGTISDSESKMLANSATTLSKPGISEKQAFKELTRVKNIFIRSKATASKNPAAKLAITEDDRLRRVLKQLPLGTINNGNGTFTLPTGETVEPE